MSKVLLFAMVCTVTLSPLRALRAFEVALDHHLAGSRQPVLKACAHRPACQKLADNTKHRPTPTPTLHSKRRKALAVWGAGAGLGLLPMQAQSKAPPTEVSKASSRPTQAQFQLPLAVGLGTCCPCDVQGEGGDEEENSGECDPTYQQVSDALAAGYRFFDTASHYNNEKSVGRAINDAISNGIVERADVLICTKVWFDDLGYDPALKSVAASNARLSLEGDRGADLVLIHFPGTIDSVQSPAKNKQLRLDTWRALERLKQQGEVKAIGISNYVRRHMKELLSSCKIKPDVAELEIHPFNQQPELVALCRANGIQVVGFSPLAHGDLPVLENEVLVAIAEAHGKTVAQVVMRWLLQEGIIPIVKTSSRQRQAENLDIDDFRLSEDDMNKIRSLDAGKRVGFDPNLIA